MPAVSESGPGPQAHPLKAEFRVAAVARSRVAVDVPEADLTRPFEESATRSLVLSLLLLLIAVIVALLLTRRITRSFGLLAKETREIAQLHFDEAPRFRGTFREVEDVLAAFDQMKLGSLSSKITSSALSHEIFAPCVVLTVQLGCKNFMHLTSKAILLEILLLMVE